MPLDDQTAMTLRRDIYGKGTAIKSDLVRLLDMSRAESPASAAFADLLAEVATDVMVNEVDPPKYIQQADADWLVAQLVTERIGKWLDAPAPGLGQFFSSMLDFNRIADDVDPDVVQNETDAKALAQAEIIDAGEADWHIARLRRDGQISNAEKRLLRFLRDESPAIAPASRATRSSHPAQG